MARAVSSEAALTTITSPTVGVNDAVVRVEVSAAADTTVNEAARVGTNYPLADAHCHKMIGSA